MARMVCLLVLVACTTDMKDPVSIDSNTDTLPLEDTGDTDAPIDTTPLQDTEVSPTDTMSGGDSCSTPFADSSEGACTLPLLDWVHCDSDGCPSLEDAPFDTGSVQTMCTTDAGEVLQVVVWPNGYEPYNAFFDSNGTLVGVYASADYPAYCCGGWSTATFGDVPLECVAELRNHTGDWDTDVMWDSSCDLPNPSSGLECDWTGDWYEETGHTGVIIDTNDTALP